MKKILFLLAGMFTMILVNAQNIGTIRGKLVDSIGKQSLQDATVTIVKGKDSVYSLAKQDGSFELKNVPIGNAQLKASFKGYFTLTKNIFISLTNPTVNLGNLYMSMSSDTLPTVTVTESPIKMKHDTIEYNAGSFHTKPNAVAEDLLQKLPGVDVDKTTGNIKAQGETVQRVLVDGKRFFGDDPKMATRNLPPDVIDKVQIFDDLSDQAKFTGFDDGNRVKTINFTTRKDKRKGYFGKTVAGIGTDGDYDESFNMHRFNGNEQISLLGQANDVNKQNFTPQDIGGGRGGGNFGGNQPTTGINTTWAGGINYRDSWSKNTDAYGSYFYNNQKVVVTKSSGSQNFLKTSGGADSSTYSNSSSNTISKTANHRINFNIESKLDTVNSIVFRPNLTIQESAPTASSTTLSTTDPNNTLINNSVTKNSSNNSGYNISGANFQFRHKFSKKFRTMSLDLNYSESLNQGNGNTYAINSFYKLNKIDTLNQYYVDTSHSYTFSPTFSYTEPLSANQIIEIRYNLSYTKSNSVNSTYEYNNNSHAFDQFDSLYSNSYKYTNTTNRLTLSYRLQKTKYNFNIGTGLQYTDQSSINTTKNVTVANNYINLTPNANFTYNFTRTKSLRLFYSGTTGQPSVSQLQPIKTISGLDTAIGNPNLRPQFTHSLRMLYQSFDPVTQRVILFTLNASTIVNDIQSSVINYKLSGTQTTTNTNLNGTYNVNAYFNYGFPLRKPKSNLNFTTNISYAQSQTLVGTDSTVINYQHNFTKNTSLGETVKWTTNLKENFDMNFSAVSTYNILTNSINPTKNSNYFTESFVTDLTYYSKSGWIVATDFTYTYYGSSTPGFNTSVPLLSPSIAKQFMKNKAGELRLTIFDVLDKNATQTTSSSGTMVTTSRTNVLSRYAMLTFTWNLRNFGNNQQGRMPGLFQGMRPPGGGGFGGGGFGGGGGGRRG